MYTSKVAYLKFKLPYKECPNECIKYRVELKNDKIQCGVCFWNDITLPRDRIPECSKCKNDYKTYINLSESKRIEFKFQHNSHCLWYDWFKYKIKQKI